MKILILGIALLLSLVACDNETKVVDVYSSGDGKSCFYLQNNYRGNETGVYCKQ